MGITGKVIMPFLSTLAALVIIVHSTEDDTESDHWRDLQPRILDTGTPTYEHPWRVVEEESTVHTWNDNSPEEPPKRRRPGRKRKQRPQSSFSEDQVPQDRYGYPGEPLRPYFEVEMPKARQIAETVKRRRKKPVGKPIEWLGGPEMDRPLRRRAQRRKRPSLDDWPQLSEFDEYNIENTSKEIITQTKTLMNTDDNQQDNANQNENISSDTTNDNDAIAEQKPLVEQTDFPLEEKDFEFLINKPELQEDKSLSEFSIEVMTQAHEPAVEEEPTRLQAKLGDKSSGVLNEHEKAKDNGPIDPVSLKDILKRSNGSSLSEILQQHNLSLADLLRGKENAISILKSEDSFEYRRKTAAEIVGESVKAVEEINTKGPMTDYRENHDKTESPKNTLSYSLKNQPIDLIPENTNGKLNSFIQNSNEVIKVKDVDIITTTENQDKVTPKVMSRIRFPTGLRKKLSMRPMMNTTYKAQLSRDLIALNARKYIHHRRNNTKSREWKNILTSVTNKTKEREENNQLNDFDTVDHINKKTTTESVEFNNTSSIADYVNKDNENINTNFSGDITTQAYTTTNVIVKEIFTNTTEEQPKVPLFRQPGDLAGKRRQHFNNRKKKRIRHQKSSTTESPPDNIIINNYYGTNEFEPLDFIPRPYKAEINEKPGVFPTNLEDYTTTRSPKINMNITKTPKTSANFFTTTSLPVTQNTNTAEETAKFEIDEIFNDTGVSIRLSKILMERNMTLNELVEHRERGSSHIHLADIFHNASKEPNPPEPFLSKSLIEPISKETYPLRAILEANLHEATVKATTIGPGMVKNNVNIPVIMDFGNNVNENAENMGIMSLFSNFTRLNLTPSNKEDSITHSIIPRDKSEIVSTVTAQLNNSSTNLRESRVLSDAANDNQDDVASWKAIFSLMRENYKNESKDLLENVKEEFFPSEDMKSNTLEEDIDGNGVVVLEDLQHLKEFDNNRASVSDENFDFNSMDRSEATSGILEIVPSQTKSVTVATASIAGLAIVLFLLTYAAFKWKQQKEGVKHNFPEERLPTPVFENRKSHQNNSSTRSISPMLSTSNIYTLNTLDSRNGKESPEYMWDTLRKPFQ